jgi:hypothetical protein
MTQDQKQESEQEEEQEEFTYQSKHWHDPICLQDQSRLVEWKQFE